MKYIKRLAIILALCMCSLKVVNASDSSFSNENTTTTDSTVSVESTTTSESVITSESQSDNENRIEEEMAENENMSSPKYNIQRSTTPTDAFQPSKKGIQIIFPFRIGYVSQPQPIQYIIESQQANLGFKTISWKPSVFTGFQVPSTLYYWKQNDDGTWPSRQKHSTYKSDVNLLSYRHATGIRLKLKPGVYYFQVSSKLTTVPVVGVFTDTVYSNLARVEVYEKAISTEKISIEAPQVIFNNAIYPVLAKTTPINATTQITWSSNNNKLAFLAEDGRSNEIEIPDMTGEVNTDVNKPGIPFTVTATAKDLSNETKSATETIYLGGLAAKVQAPTDNFSWELDQQGLLDLDEAVESDTTWNYEWKFYDGDKELKNVSDNIDNISGTVTSLSDLNSPEKAIYIKNNSSLMKKAYEYSEKGQYISAQVTLTTEVVIDDKGNTDKVTMMSNKASLTVRKPPEELTIKQVPDFIFGSIPVSYIYEGTGNNIVSSERGTIEVVDTRENSNGWILTASMDRFKTTSGTQLASTSIINIKGNEYEAKIKDDNMWTPLMQSDTSETISVIGNLGLSPNPTINLQKDDMFSSIITWNLVNATLRAGSL